ncbi:sodium:solute symporter family protein [Ruicaihuangia caeni]|uniref:Sodium:solute symporter family protein n=1 Tax=Ruicaihuangia caeni TaxID=3042517 RepID=A0AAW6T3M5_9MICO|nr:sodium:solute symporter family protein [Klugiella sp. YN-L-19]MDI2098436.1 sodium:solute symporter family protein [Klugiella sp. YN-L-19]
MDILIGYGGLVLFLIITIVAMERARKPDTDFSSYATAGRSFGPIFGTMAYVNTFLPGTVFISFAGLAALSGIIGYYLMAYALLGVLLMVALSKPVFRWGKKFDLGTQSDLLALRYRSRPVRLVASAIGIIATIPWIVLGLQSLALVFEYLSAGSLVPIMAIVLSVVVIGVRQIWTVRHGMRGIIISDMVQGIFAYLIGTVIAIGLLVMLLTNGHGFSDVPEGFTSLLGPNEEYGPLYAVAITLTGALGTWCWPDIFVRLFTARSSGTIRKTAGLAAPLMLVFTTAVLTVAYLASSDERVAAAPDHVWFIVAGDAGIWVLTLAAIAVVGATLGNVGANIQAVGAQAANDIVGVVRPGSRADTRVAKWAVGITTAVSALIALSTLSSVSGLVGLALISYQGIVQLAPTLLLGIFWKRATAAGAVWGMLVGFTMASVLQALYPVQIPWLGGLTSGLVAMIFNAATLVLISVLRPQSAEEKQRVDDLWALVKAERDPKTESADTALVS